MRWVLGLAILLTVARAQAGELRELRLLDGPEGTRVVFDLDASADNNVFTLANPDRVVIDIAAVKRGRGLNLNPAPAGLVKGVRSGPHDGGLRVVLDVNGAVTPKTFGLKPSGGYGYRLILDLAPAGAAAPAMVTADAAPAPATAAPAPAAPVPAPVAAAAAPLAAAIVPAVAVQSAPVAPAPVTPVASAAASAALPLAAAPARDPVALTAKTVVVAVDAGHGGDDPGAQSHGGLQEKNVTLAIARMLARRINATPGMKAVLTRDGDYYVGLRERTIKARKAQADLFVSIHCNSYRDHDMRGTAIYVLSDHGATTEQARWLANHENAADLVGGVDLHDKDDRLAAVLLDISQSATMDASFDLGNRLLGSMSRINELQKPIVQQAGFMVLKSPDIPSVLVETAFISNPREEQMLRSAETQSQFADGIFEGIKGYFSRYRPLQQPQQVVAATQPQAKPARRNRRGKAMPVAYEPSSSAATDDN
jgi:N-acetylmuramoyl-L-alanine amidase